MQNLKEKLQGALELKGKVLKGALEAGAGLAEGAAKVAPQIIATKAQVRETTNNMSIISSLFQFDKFEFELGNENGCKKGGFKNYQSEGSFQQTVMLVAQDLWRTKKARKSVKVAKPGLAHILIAQLTGAPSHYDMSSCLQLIPKLCNECGYQALWKSLVSSSLCKSCDP